MIVVDTNVVSELMKPPPSAAAKDWVLAPIRSRAVHHVDHARRDPLRHPTASERETQGTSAHHGTRRVQRVRRPGASLRPNSRRALLVGRRHPGSSAFRSVVSTHRSLPSVAPTMRGWRRVTPRTSSTPGSTLSIRGNHDLRAVGQPERGLPGGWRGVPRVGVLFALMDESYPRCQNRFQSPGRVALT